MQNPFDPGYYDENDLRPMGFAGVGEQVRIAKNCTIVGDLRNIRLGSHVRIDSYTTLVATGAITIGSRIHIAGYCHISGGDGIIMHDFSGLSQGVKLYSRTDDYSGNRLTNPMVPKELTGVVAGCVTVGRHAIIGANTVVLPGVTIGEGCSVGAQSLVKSSLEPWGIYVGCPVIRIRDRSRSLLTLEALVKG